jgi:translation initiation factor IF-3
MDYGKWRYEQEQRAKQARKHQSTINIKEIKLRPKIGDPRLRDKKGHVVRFLNQRAKVKVTIMFRGRENLHPERGRMLLERSRRTSRSSVRSSSSPRSTAGTW